MVSTQLNFTLGCIWSFAVVAAGCCIIVIPSRILRTDEQMVEGLYEYEILDEIAPLFDA